MSKKPELPIVEMRDRSNKFATKTRVQRMEIFKKENEIHNPIQSASEVFKDHQALTGILSGLSTRYGAR